MPPPGVRAEPGHPAPGRSVTLPPGTVIGQRFGNYRALSLLGEGGMGAVFLAEHPAIGRRVAVKVLRAEFSRDQELLARFLNEARAANAIRHPSIIEILDSGTTDNGMPYLVMELLEGESLSARIRRLGRLATGDALECAYQTASAVGAAHRKGIVHRDLKPDNLFVIPDATNPGRERVKVLDFGIAKLQSAALTGDHVKTRTGTLIGTPVYMSPEQCLGTKEVDHRSDVYSLGVILYEMICGQPPFVSAGFGELVHMHLSQSPPAPRGLAPATSAAVEAVILRALAKKPDDRFAAMTDFQEALREAGGADFTVRGISTPDFARTLPGAEARAPTAPTNQTTFTTSSGEKTQPPTSGRRKIWIGAAVGAVVVLAVAFNRLGSTEPPPPPVTAPPLAARPPPVAPEPPPPAPVIVKIATLPAGAEVVRLDNGASLGTTPLQTTRRPGDPPVAVRIEKPGFAPVTRALADIDEVVTLQALPPRPKPAKKRPRPSGEPEPAKL